MVRVHRRFNDAKRNSRDHTRSRAFTTCACAPSSAREQLAWTKFHVVQPHSFTFSHASLNKDTQMHSLVPAGDFFFFTAAPSAIGLKIKTRYLRFFPSRTVTKRASKNSSACVHMCVCTRALKSRARCDSNGGPVAVATLYRVCPADSRFVSAITTGCEIGRFRSGGIEAAPSSVPPTQILVGISLHDPGPPPSCCP